MSAPAACAFVRPLRLRTLPSAREPETGVSSPDPSQNLRPGLSTRGCLRLGLTLPPTRAGLASPHPVPRSRSPGGLGLEVLLDPRVPASPHSVCQHIPRITHTLDRGTAPHFPASPHSSPRPRPPSAPARIASVAG